MTPLQAALIRVEMEEVRRRPCLVCGRPPYSVGLWFPTESVSRRLGAPPGKAKVSVYALCRKCSRTPEDTMEPVERFFLDQARAGRPPRPSMASTSTPRPTR